MSGLQATVGWLHLFGDPTRVRLMTLVSREELTVAELTSITELAQPRVSTHLGKLREAGLLRDRRVGGSTYYSANPQAMPADARAVWEAVARVEDPIIESDERRCQALVKAREKATRWPDALAGQMERYYSPGRTWEATARGLCGLLRLGDVLDAGSGDGTLAQLLAPRARSVTCLDRSERMIEAARERLAREKNVAFQVGDLHQLPFAADSFDQVLCLNVLTYAEDPGRVLAEAARVLRPGGDLVVVTLEAHAHDEALELYHHVNRGFTQAALRRLITRAGLEIDALGPSHREKRQPHFEVLQAFAHKARS